MATSNRLRKNWSEKELIAAFNLYCKISFGSIHHRNPKVIELAKLINRSPNAMALKLSNFASFDPELQARGIRGLKNASKKDAEIFDRFYENREDLAFESEIILANFEEKTVEEKHRKDLPDLESLKGEDKQRYVKTRVNQNFFRAMILANYEGKCALTGIDISQILFASHIIPWSLDPENRLNPTNGICLSAHFDTAFDKGLISFDNGYRVILNPILEENRSKPFFYNWFKQFEGLELKLPYKAKPGLEFLEWHRKEYLNQ
ncbi:putative restriction endonuclease [Tangfeifania diversioriginum]|uniref:Putative restriction endonuclease n=1 Tax=Tangfeifania diversioriginum TaxID=1168035 RepID=A0A1M6KP49_9BACT|nr:HNH endonuclease [Tangfeifania diversioriginum]SHJ60727.1 putative restriction endonuclease [Tangfeifania diversioriginum]